MVDIRRVKVAWQTGAGGTGLSVFHSAAADDATASLGTFFNAIKALFPTAVSWSIPATGDTIDVATGVLTGTWVGGTAASITATGGGTYAAGTGLYVRWATALVVGGRRLQGRTFLCPVISGVYDNDGTITAGNLTTVGTAAAALVTAGKCGIWHRPTSPGASNGSFSSVTGSTVPDRVTSLRTRRT